MAMDPAEVETLKAQMEWEARRTAPPAGFPNLPDMPAATGTVSSDVFAHAVQQAVTAAGRDDMLPVLTGVRIEISGSTISMLASPSILFATSSASSTQLP